MVQAVAAWRRDEWFCQASRLVWFNCCEDRADCREERVFACRVTVTTSGRTKRTASEDQGCK